MSITASGLFGLTWEKMWIDTAGQSMEAETHKCMMTEDAYTPDFNAHDFRADVTNEVAGTGYSAGGATITATEWTISGGVATYDHADVTWASSTIPNAMCGIDYFNVGAAGTDQLLFLMDFVTAASSSGGTFTIQINASGAVTLDFTP
jgi:hypothetical protein